MKHLLRSAFISIFVLCFISINLKAQSSEQSFYNQMLEEAQRRSTSRVWSDKDRGYKNFKFGMSVTNVRTTNLCDKWAKTKYYWIIKGKNCYKIAGNKRDFLFIFSKHNYPDFVAFDEIIDYWNSSRLEIIMIDFGMYDNSFFDVLKKSLKKKYKLEYELSDAAMIRNNLAKMIFHDEGRVSLVQDNIDGKMYIQYSDNPAKEYIKFLPNKLKDVDSSEL